MKITRKNFYFISYILYLKFMLIINIYLINKASRVRPCKKLFILFDISNVYIPNTD